MEGVVGDGGAAIRAEEGLARPDHAGQQGEPGLQVGEAQGVEGSGELVAVGAPGAPRRQEGRAMVAERVRHAHPSILPEKSGVAGVPHRQRDAASRGAAGEICHKKPFSGNVLHWPPRRSGGRGPAEREVEAV